MLTYHSQSSMEHPINNLEIVHIPCQGSPICSTSIQLIDLGSKGINKDEYSPFEKELGHIPNVQSIGDPTNFSWANRCLIGTSVKTVHEYWGKAWQADYMIYLCQEAGAGLPPNEYLNQLLEEAKKTARRTPTISAVYGDAFVFIKEPKTIECDESEQAKYKNMHEEFVPGVYTYGFTRALLQVILVQPDIGDL